MKCNWNNTLTILCCVAGVLYKLASLIEAFLCGNHLLGNTKCIHNALIKHDAAVCSFFYYIYPALIIWWKYLSVIRCLNMRCKAVPSAKTINQSLLVIFWISL